MCLYFTECEIWQSVGLQDQAMLNLCIDHLLSQWIHVVWVDKYTQGCYIIPFTYIRHYLYTYLLICMYWNIHVCILHAHHEYEKPKQAATILHYKILKLNDITNERFWFFHIENKRGLLKQKSSPCKKAVKE